MSHKKVALQEIKQKDNHTFTIVWTDGKIADYRLDELQVKCPCAGCVDESTGKRRPGALAFKDVSAKKIRSVGRYAIRVDYTNGCSHGIYDFKFLRELKGLN